MGVHGEASRERKGCAFLKEREEGDLVIHLLAFWML